MAEFYQKYWFKFSLYGFFTGILISVYVFFSFLNNFGEFLSNVLIYVPFKLIFSIATNFHLCPSDSISQCGWHALDLAIFSSPFFYGILGLVIGFVFDKVHKKKSV